jgi:alcohol dehydrogenase
MQSLVFVRPRVLEWRERPTPAIRDDGDAIIRPLAASICDIDRHVVEGTSPWAGPFAIGHEAIGQVVDVGGRVSRVRPGDFVVVAWHIACGTCGRCSRGLSAHCENVPPQAMYGLPSGGDWGGLFDDLVRVPFADSMLVPIPDAIDPLSVVSAGDNLTLGLEVMGPHLRAHPDSDVLILGAGAVGLYQAQVACALTRRPVTYIDDDRARLETAAALGAVTAMGPPTREHGSFDLIVDASFKPRWLQKAVRMLRPEGVFECLGGYFQDVPLPLFAMYAGGVRFRIGRSNIRPHIEPLLDLVAAGVIDPTRLYTEVIPWQDAPRALAYPTVKPVATRLDAPTPQPFALDSPS